VQSNSFWKSRGSRGSRSNLGWNAFRDHCLAAACAAGTTAVSTTAVSTTAAGTGLAATAFASWGSFAVATVLATVATLATLVVLLSMAALAAMATVASNSTRVTADEGDGNQCKEHSNCKSEKTLHHIPPVRDYLTPMRPYKAVTKQPRFGTATEPQQTISKINPRQTSWATGCTPPQALTVG